MKFSEMPYKRPDPEAVKAEYRTLTDRLKNAGSYEEARAVFLEKEEAEKIVQDKSAQMQVASSEAQSKLKASLETAVAEVCKEKNLSAVLIKDAVPAGGVDVTEEVIKKMK